MALISIITRSKDRPIMMARAVESVCNQTLRDVEWVIVNDGGAPAPVDAIADVARARGVTVKVLHNPVSLGMEGASNRGLRESDSRYVVIHDDDDTWEPAFLERTTAHLQAVPAARPVRGVVSRVTQVVEEIRNDRIIERFRLPYHRGLKTVTLFQMAHLARVPPPISFLYRRDALVVTGLYRQDLEVLGDWEFNLRFLVEFDIDVLPDYLANYHWRATAKGTYANTVVAGLDRHAVVAARLRNEFLRKDLAEGRFGLGVLVNLCQEFEALQQRDSLLEALARRFLSIERKLWLSRLLRL